MGPVRVAPHRTERTGPHEDLPKGRAALCSREDPEEMVSWRLAADTWGTWLFLSGGIWIVHLCVYHGEHRVPWIMGYAKNSDFCSEFNFIVEYPAWIR